MDPIPSGWPPRSEGTSPPVVPLFPLPQIWLVPRVFLPLRIFERRYRQMIEDCLDGPGRIVLGTVVHGYEDEILGSPPIYPIAGLGEIGRHDRKADGQFEILLYGIERVSVREVPSDRLYRKVEFESAIEKPVPLEQHEELHIELEEAIRTRNERGFSREAPISMLIDYLTLTIPLPAEMMQQCYMEMDLEQRARRVLSEHAIRPVLKEMRGGERDMGFPGFE